MRPSQSDMTPGIGHNREPADPLRVIAWRRVVASQPRLSPVTVRMRMARADELGMSYADYAAVRTVSGRDPAALVFSPASLGLGLGRRLTLPAQTAAHLALVRRCHLLCLCPSAEDPAAFAEELCEVSGVRFAGASPMPDREATWDMMRRTVRCLLDPLRLSGNAAVMIGDGYIERTLCAAGRMADCLSGLRYFAPVARSGPYSVAASRVP